MPYTIGMLVGLWAMMTRRTGTVESYLVRL